MREAFRSRWKCDTLDGANANHIEQLVKPQYSHQVPGTNVITVNYDRRSTNLGRKAIKCKPEQD